MIDLGNGNVYEVIDVDNGLEITSQEEFERICKEGHAAIMLDLGYTKYPVLITFLANYPDTPYTLHVLYGPMPIEQETDVLQKLKEVKGLKSIRSNKSIRVTPKLVNSFLAFLQKR